MNQVAYSEYCVCFQTDGFFVLGQAWGELDGPITWFCAPLLLRVSHPWSSSCACLLCRLSNEHGSFRYSCKHEFVYYIMHVSVIVSHEQWHCYLFCDSQSKVIRKQLESLPPKFFFVNKGPFRSGNKNGQWSYT